MNNNPLIELELRKLGLTEKEVRVYLAGLDLGPNSVQNIARITKLARPTAYEIIKKLEEKGLFIESKGDKKNNPRLFTSKGCCAMFYPIIVELLFRFFLCDFFLCLWCAAATAHFLLCDFLFCNFLFCSHSLSPAI